jgi:hypothetical protein
MNMITFTPEMLARFKAAYRIAVDAKVDTFRFDDKEFVVSYAKYLIEYLDGQLLDKGQRQPK